MSCLIKILIFQRICVWFDGNKWLLHSFNNEIGIIGAKEKIELIHKLMANNQYKDYLGIDKFNTILKYLKICLLILPKQGLG